MKTSLHLKISMYLLPTLFCVISYGLSSIQEIGPYNAATIENVSIDRFDKLLGMSEKIQSLKPLYKYLNETFAEVREVQGIDQRESVVVKSSALTTDQIVYLLHEFADLENMLAEYSNKVTAENFDTPDIAEFRKKMKKQLQGWLKSNETLKTLMKLNSPSEPLLVLPSSEIPAFTKIDTFVNHPYLRSPEKPEAGFLPADDLQAEVVKFIDGAKRSLMINIYEFNLKEIAKALLRAKERGVEVIIGIDKNTLKNAPSNEEVREILRSAESDKFTVVEVDPVGINHQKVVARDAGTIDGAVLFSSGNFTQSCIGKEGDLVQIPAEKRPSISIPNANHAVVIQSPYLALVTKYELRKTLVMKLRGSQYPLSGSFVFQGLKDRISQKNDFIMVAFSPNGGMGDVNKDILAHTISKSTGRIWDMMFAFSSPDVIAALKSKAKSENESGKTFDFKGIGDTSFAMRPWSGFLNLSGWTFDPLVGKYSASPDANGLSSFLSVEQIQKLQEQIRVNPRKFRDAEIKVDGQSYKVSVKLHHKSMGFPDLNWAFMGKSFNDSVSAENNQEQILLIGNRMATRKLWAGFSYLHNQSPLSVVEYAEFRNSRGMKPSEDVSGKLAKKIETDILKSAPVQNEKNMCLKFYSL